MTNLLDNLDLEITCTNCNSKTKKTIGWIKNNSEFICACGTRIHLDASQFRTQIAEVERSISSLKDTLNKFNK